MEIGKGKREAIISELAKTCFMLMVNAAGVKAEDEEAAVGIIEELLRNYKPVKVAGE